MIRLLVDSSADFSKAEIEEKKLLFVPLQVTIEDKNYLDGIDIFTNEFYEKMIATDGFFKTSQPSPQQFLDHFQKAKENNDTLICILISSALSGTIQSAILAKNIVEYDNIYIVDALTTTVGIRVMIDKAIVMIKEGKEAKEIVTYLEEMRSHIKILAAVDTLEYLCKGGRVSKTTAAIGEMANIKPIVTVSLDGKVDVIGKRLGINKTISYIWSKMEEFKIDKNYPIYSLFTYGTENCEKLEARFEKNGIKASGRLQIGPTIGTHVGPGAFGVCFVEKF